MNKRRSFTGIVLAAGKGTRMGGDLPKVLYQLCGKPMIMHVIETARSVDCENVIVVVGYKADQVKSVLSSEKDLVFAYQAEQLGTGHAVRCAIPHIPQKTTDLLILFGDVPLITPETLSRLIKHHMDEDNDITILTSLLEDPKGYGRIVLCPEGRFVKIVEEKDADHLEKLIKEVNTGICCVSRRFLEDSVVRIGRTNAQNEFYFTDIIEIGCRENRRVGRCSSKNPIETSGVNTGDQLKKLEDYIASGILTKELS